MKKFNRAIGAKGEEIASNYLKQNGYQILDRNNLTRWGELDLIVTKNKTLVFVEVKFKTTEEFGTPEEMISQNKLIQVKRTAEMYLAINPDIAQKYESYQIDAVCIVGQDGKIDRLEHYENLGF